MCAWQWVHECIAMDAWVHCNGCMGGIAMDAWVACTLMCIAMDACAHCNGCMGGMCLCVHCNVCIAMDAMELVLSHRGDICACLFHCNEADDLHSCGASTTLDRGNACIVAICSAERKCTLSHWALVCPQSVFAWLQLEWFPYEPCVLVQGLRSHASGIYIMRCSRARPAFSCKWHIFYAVLTHKWHIFHAVFSCKACVLMQVAYLLWGVRTSAATTIPHVCHNSTRVAYFHTACGCVHAAAHAWIIAVVCASPQIAWAYRRPCLSSPWHAKVWCSARIKLWCGHTRGVMWKHGAVHASHYGVGTCVELYGSMAHVWSYVESWCGAHIKLWCDTRVGLCESMAHTLNYVEVWHTR